MRTARVNVVPYDPEWRSDFEKIKRELDVALGNLALAVEYIGSTSVEGMSAKPCIDIDVVIEDSSMLKEAIERLADIGYIHEGDLGIAGREAFDYKDKPHLAKHHLYVCPKDSAELHRHISFRDYLRENPDAVKEYSRIKEEGAELFFFDIDKYIEHKSPFIDEFYKMFGLDT